MCTSASIGLLNDVTIMIPAAAWIQPRNRLSIFDMICFLLSNSYTLQTQPDRLT